MSYAELAAKYQALVLEHAQQAVRITELEQLVSNRTQDALRATEQEAIEQENDWHAWVAEHPEIHQGGF